MSRCQIVAGWATLAIAASFAHAEPDPVAAPEPRGLRPELNEIKRIVYRRSCLAVAQVVRETGVGDEIGSGFFIGAPGQLVTVLRSEEPTETIWVNYGADAMRRFEAEVLASDPYTGLTLLAVAGVGEVGALKLAERASLEPADYVYGVAETGDEATSCAVGRVAGKEKLLHGETLAASVWRLHIEAPAQGFGAPLLDREANLVGVLLLGDETEEGEKPSGLGYALPVEHVAKLLRDHKRHGAARAAWLGLGMTMGTSTPEIRSLREGSPARVAGLKTGDVILSIGDRKVADYQDVIDACYALTADEPVRFRVLRGLDDLELTVVPVVRRPPGG